MKSQRTALLVAAFLSGLFTGLMLTFLIVIQRVLVSLSASEYTRIMQGLIAGADRPPIVPAIVIVTVLAPLVTLIQMRHDRQSPVFRLTLIGWVLFVLGVLVVTVGFNAPINNVINTWSVQAPPADWMETRDRWNQLNLLRTPASALAFLCFLLALAAPERIQDAPRR
jgi:uncharacterized membrane protein